MIHAIDETTLKTLPLANLVQRMDDILCRSVIERYGVIRNEFQPQLISHIIATKKVRALPDDVQRYLAHIAFSYLVQLEMGSVSSGMSNALLYNDKYNEKTSWQSPVFRLRDGAIHQYQIVSSRIAMEIFMDLLYCIDTGQRLEKKKSKLTAFGKWLCNKDNQFHYFAHVLLAAYGFDRGIRTPEVHGTPRLPKRLLLLQKPSHEEMNECHHLSNALSGCWRPLLELLNEKKPSYMNINQADAEWFHVYMTGTEKEIVSKLNSMWSDRTKC
jgi:hypothetical protein